MTQPKFNKGDAVMLIPRDQIDAVDANNSVVQQLWNTYENNILFIDSQANYSKLREAYWYLVKSVNNDSVTEMFYEHELVAVSEDDVKQYDIYD
ncbi:MAG: hypothetical protein MJZ20_14545 [Bacteroidaceae bacterium]|nr:hypothetical protein [Bacteroidaceae bacterium]